MICPRCQQAVEHLSEGLCPYCKYPCAQFHRKVTTVQVVLGAIFASTLVYGAVVAILELAVDYRPPGTGVSEHLLGVALLVLSGTPVTLVWVVASRRAGSGDPDQMQTGLIMMAAAAETPAVCGLVAYLVVGSLMWFVIMLGVSWLLFLRLGMSLPEYLNTIKDAISAGGNGRRV